MYRMDEERLEKYLQRKRLSATVLRTEHPDLLHIFKVNKFDIYRFHRLIAMRIGSFKLSSFKECVLAQFPNNDEIETFIADNASKAAIKQLIKNVCDLCDEHRE